jgi:hypothetical protein
MNPCYNDYQYESWYKPQHAQPSYNTDYYRAPLAYSPYHGGYDQREHFPTNSRHNAPDSYQRISPYEYYPAYPNNIQYQQSRFDSRLAPQSGNNAQANKSYYNLE